MKRIERRRNSHSTLLASVLTVLLLILLGGADQAHAQWTTNGSDINNTNSGNVGIGTTTPSSLLEINKAQNAGTTLVLDNGYNTAGNAAYSGFWFRQSGANRFFFGAINDGNSTQVGGPGAVQLWNFAAGPTLFATNNAERMRIDASGNVGIGTTTPTSDLGGITGLSGKVVNVQNSSGLAQILISGSSGGAYVGYEASNATAGKRLFQQYYDGTNNLMKFRVISESTGSVATDNILVLQNGGNIGIGTTTPTDLNTSGTPKILQIHNPTSRTSSVSSYSLLSLSSAATANSTVIGAISFGTTDAASAEKRTALILSTTTADSATSPTGDLQFYTFNGGSANQSMEILANGNVGIGQSNPTYKLDVSGTAHVTGNVTVDGNINAKYQDVAEWVQSTHALSAGTVVILNPDKSNQVMASTKSYDTRVAGVVSERPGLALGESGKDKVLVATTGRVRVKVDATRAPIHVGDLLVTSDVEGVAMKSEPVDLGGVKLHRPGTLIGKALENLDKGTGEILVLLSLQ